MILAFDKDFMKKILVIILDYKFTTTSGQGISSSHYVLKISPMILAFERGVY